MTYMDIKPSKTKNWATQDYHIHKFVKKLKSRATIIDNYAVLIVYNEKQPSLSYILKESL